MGKIVFKILCIAFSLVLFQNCAQKDNSALEKQNSKTVYQVVKVDDFEINGQGNNANWDKADWLHLDQRWPAPTKDALTTKAKALYSQSGIYFLFYCQDRKLTSTMEADFMDLWKEDVAEVFLWPDERIPFYFEYEISPMGYELPILVSNIKGDLTRWQPFHYDADRKTRRATTVNGGIKKSHATISGWIAEFFIPNKLLRPLNNVPPMEGTKWRANFYRVDYDDDGAGWSWQPTGESFHEFEKFGILLFE